MNKAIYLRQPFEYWQIIVFILYFSLSALVLTDMIPGIHGIILTIISGGVLVFCTGMLNTFTRIRIQNKKLYIGGQIKQWKHVNQYGFSKYDDLTAYAYCIDCNNISTIEPIHQKDSISNYDRIHKMFVTKKPIVKINFKTPLHLQDISGNEGLEDQKISFIFLSISNPNKLRSQIENNKT